MAKTYHELGNKKELKKIIKSIKNISNQEKWKFSGIIGEIYFLLNDFDKSLRKFWDYIRISTTKKLKNYYDQSRSYLYLVEIYIWKGDFIKAHHHLHNAKALCGNWFLSDPKIKEIYKAIGVFYLNRKCYKDASQCFKSIQKFCPGHELLFVNFCIGIAYFYRLKNSKALKTLTDVKEKMHEFSEVYKNQLFIVNAYIGELHKLEGRIECAHDFFSEAIRYVDSYDFCRVDFFMNSSSYTFSYFYEISDYEKCGSILLRINEILQNYEHLKFRKPYFIILWAELYIALDETKQVEEYLGEAENLLNINLIVHPSQRHIKANELDCIGDYIELAKIYINLIKYSEENYIKAEKILKYSEEIVSTKLRNDLISKLTIYYWLGRLYYEQQRWKESKNYYQMSLDIHEKFDHNSFAEENLSRYLRDIDEILEMYG